MSDHEIISVAVITPTYARGAQVVETLRRIKSCSPQPSEILVHVDKSDGTLEEKILAEFNDVTVLSSKDRLGPGGGRHKLLTTCRAPYAVSFDDDSYPVDSDFFATVYSLFENHPDVAVIEGTIWCAGDPMIPRQDTYVPAINYTGCGHATRIAAYQQVRGYLPRMVPYGMEETDVALQLFARGWKVAKSGLLRIYHDTQLTHHRTPEVVAGTIANIGLFAFLHYPWQFMACGCAQVLNMVWFSVRQRRWHGIMRGIFEIPSLCLRFRQFRQPVTPHVLREYFTLRRSRPDTSGPGLEVDSQA